MNIQDLFDLVAQEKASDLLISAGAPPILRIHGQLFRSRTDALTPEQTERLIFDFLTDEQREQFLQNKELDFSLASGRRHRFRVNVYRQKGAVTAAFRPIPESIPGLADLGLPEAVASIAKVKQGLVLVTGPTGHGKTTTQAALIDLINHERACHIITVEDPIEYVHTHKKSIVDQREVGGDTNSFPTALKYVLRQDPDVILIGEMRDLETISAALTIAETGHLALATLHTNSAPEAINRMIDVFPPTQQAQVRAQLAFVLEGIVTQVLLPKASGKGRVMVAEILVATPAIRAVIRDDKVHQITSLMQAGKKHGMQTMNDALYQLYMSREIAKEEALRVSPNPSEFLRSIGETPMEDQAIAAVR